MPDVFPSSTLNLKSLQPADTPALLDIRPFLSQLRNNPEIDAFTKIQQAIDALQQVIRTQSPTLEYLSIEAADIASLNVGSQFGPGQMAVLNGPPNYDNIGWFGSAPNATPVDITSISGGTVTTVDPHDLKPGDNVYIEGTTVSIQTGYYVVDTAPTDTTFTVVGGIAGNSTGGEMTKQFQGGWLKTFAVGGTNFADAPFQVDVDGELTITNALIRLIGAGGTITLDPDVPWITIADGGDNIWAILGIQTDAPKNITGATNASPIVVTIVGHGYVDGDTIFNEGATSNTNVNGYRIVRFLTVDTFSMTDIDGVQVNGNGAFAGPATATRYYAGGLFSSLAIGTSWDDYKLRAFADGSLKIRDALITLSGSSADITLDPSDGTITVVQAGGGFRTVLSGAGIVMTNDDEPGDDIQVTPGYYEATKQSLTGIVDAKMVQLNGYGLDFGPLIAFTGQGGSVSSPGASQSGDVLGGLIVRGYDGTVESVFPASIYVVAAQTHSSGNHGTKIEFRITPSGSATPGLAMLLDTDGTLDVDGGYKVNGTPGVDLASTAFGVSLTVNNIVNAVRGTPGAGQSNFTAVTTVVLNTTNHTFDKGILTA